MDTAKPEIKIMRPGTFRSAEGNAVTFSKDDLAAAAAAYDPLSDPAPLVIGHPKMDDPAYGWVESLSMQGDMLIATPGDIDASFAEDVRAHKYRKVSAQLYPPTHAHNPKPGQWYLKHIGFLGAHAPGVKGLGTVSFGEDEAEGTVNVTTHYDWPGAQAFSEFQPETETQTEKEPNMADKKETPNEPENKGDVLNDAVSFAERQSALDTREAKIAAREEAAIKRENDARHAANVSFAEGLVAEAKLAPAGKDLLVGVLDQLDVDVTASFGEAGEMSAPDALKKLLSGASPLVSLGEVGGKPREKTALASFTAPSGYEVSPEDADLYSRAKALQAANSDLSWGDAVRQAQV